ncbi:MAG: GspE/PulE family protein [Pseudomonadota bacterium]
MEAYDNPAEVGEILYEAGILDDQGLIRLQEAELYISDRLAQEHAKQLKRAVPEAHRPTAVDVIAEMRLAGPRGIVDEPVIVQAIAARYGYPFTRLDSLELDPEFVTRTLPQKFANRFLILPIGEVNGKLRIATHDPAREELFGDVARVSGRELDLVIAPKEDIRKIILEFHGFRGSIKAAEEKHVKHFSELSDLERLVEVKSLEEISHTDKNIRTAVDAMFRRSISLRASDIHIEPKRRKSVIRMRIDGVLHDIDQLPGPLHQAFVSRIKGIAGLDIAEKRRPQDGRIKLDAQTVSKGEVEVRVSTVPTAFGEKTVCRLQDPDLLFMDLEEIGFTPRDEGLFRDFVGRPHGIILVTGPTGSGKTTTLYSGLRQIATPDKNITTIEDPVEMVSERFNQIQVSPGVSMLHDPNERMTFGPILRHVMRQDPDVIMIGEIRDAETSSLAVQAALTGHLVLSTIHTNDALSAITRMLDLDVPHFLLGNTLIGLIAQRLMRKICLACKEPYAAGLKELNKTGFNFEGPENIMLFRGKGCHQCRDTGYFGRESVYEVVGVDDDIAKLITPAPDMRTLKEAARKKKCSSLWENAVRKMLDGITTVEEVLRVTRPDPYYNEPIHLRKSTKQQIGQVVQV